MQELTSCHVNIFIKNNRSEKTIGAVIIQYGRTDYFTTMADLLSKSSIRSDNKPVFCNLSDVANAVLGCVVFGFQYIVHIAES